MLGAARYQCGEEVVIRVGVSLKSLGFYLFIIDMASFGTQFTVHTHTHNKSILMAPTLPMKY